LRAAELVSACDSAGAVAPRRRFYPFGQFTINWGDLGLAENET